MQFDDPDEREYDDPEDGDYVTRNHRTFYQYGKPVLTIGEDDDMWSALDSHMEREGFFPNVWFESDHGNYHLMTRE